MSLALGTIQINIGTLMVNNASLLGDIQQIASDVFAKDKDVATFQQENKSYYASSNQTGRRLSPLPLDETMTNYKNGRVSHERIKTNAIEIRLLMNLLPAEDILEVV